MVKRMKKNEKKWRIILRTMKTRKEERIKKNKRMRRDKERE